MNLNKKNSKESKNQARKSRTFEWSSKRFVQDINRFR